MSELYHARLLTRSQRRTLIRLRSAVQDMEGAHSAHSLARTRCPFLRLASFAEQLGVSAATTPNHLVSREERLLLAAMAALQRRSPLALSIESALLDLLAQCANAALDEGDRLPFSEPMRTLLRTQGWLSRDPEAAAQHGRTSHHGSRHRARCGPLRQKALDYAECRSSVTAAELRAIGISRQTLSLICRAGLLERVSFGVYRSIRRAETDEPSVNDPHDHRCTGIPPGRGPV